MRKTVDRQNLLRGKVDPPDEEALTVRHGPFGVSPPRLTVCGTGLGGGATRCENTKKKNQHKDDSFRGAGSVCSPSTSWRVLSIVTSVCTGRGGTWTKCSSSQTLCAQSRATFELEKPGGIILLSHGAKNQRHTRSEAETHYDRRPDRVFRSTRDTLGDRARELGQTARSWRENAKLFLSEP